MNITSLTSNGTLRLVLLAALWMATHAHQAQAGAVLRLYYDGIPGTSVAALKESLTFPGSPSFQEVLTEALEGVDNEPDVYGSWIRGYLEAPQSGEYTFWIASDDDSEFWLSTDHTAANRQKIAENLGAVGNREFEAKAMQRSAPITLQRAQKYYFEIFHKDGTGGAHIAVGWQLPDGSIQRPIAGEHLMPFPINATLALKQTAPVILTDYFGLPVPTISDTLVNEGEPALFRVTVEATQPATFQWLRDGAEIAGANLSWYQLEAPKLSDRGARFSVRVSNSLGTVTSKAAVLTVQPDTVAPALLSATTRGNPNGLDVRFSEAVDPASATNAANYKITPSVEVNGALLVNPQTVRLRTANLTEGRAYTLAANNVKDRSAAGNTIASNSQVRFLQVQGVITEKEFRDIPGPLLTDLTTHARFPDRPDALRFATAFETTPLRRDNYGLQFQGYVIPPATGDYIFYVSSRNQSALFLSPDDNPARMIEIAREADFSTPRDWESVRPDGGNISAPQKLEAGKKYYIEGRMKAAARTGAVFVDHFAVAWQKPGDPPPANGDPPIPGEFLSAFAVLGSVTIKSAPASVALTELETLNLAVLPDGTPPYTYQWFKDGKAITGATESALVLADVRLGDNGAKITVRVTNPFSEATSAPATLTVNRDTASPAIEEVTARNITTTVNVVFSERVDAGEAQNPANYTITPGITVREAKLLGDGRTVALTTSPLTGGARYTLSVAGIKDRADQPNRIAPGAARQFTFIGTSRVTEGLQALYTFREGSGTAVKDVSGVGVALDLEIREPAKVDWLPSGGLALKSETRIVSTAPATKINDAAKASNELTVEVWVKPAHLEQQGPARIVTVSQGPLGSDRNFSLNQGRFGETPDNRAKWTARGSQASGVGDMTTPQGTATTNLQHVVFTHNAGAGDARIYVDGIEVHSTQPSGNFRDWRSDRGLVLGNENTLVGSGRFWVGEIHLVAVYSRALSAAAVKQNFDAGLVVPPAPPPEVRLGVARAGADVVFSWPAGAEGFVLETSASVSAQAWSIVPGSPVVSGDRRSVTVSPKAGAAFYRLRRP